MKTFSKLSIVILLSIFSGFIIISCGSSNSPMAPGNSTTVELQLVFPQETKGAGLQKSNAINEVTVSVVDFATIDLFAGELSNKPAVLIKEQSLQIFQTLEGRYAEGVLDIPVTDDIQTFDVIVFASDPENLLFLSGHSRLTLQQDQDDAAPLVVVMGQAVSITSFGEVSASSTFSPGDFGPENGNDLDFESSWFSAGTAADPGGAVYTWTAPEPQFIGTMGVFNNSEHSNPEYRNGFGFDKVTYKIFSGANNTGDLLFEETIDYPKTEAIPVLRVSPMVVGQSVELTLTGHESEICGGFSELLIVNPLIPGPDIGNTVIVNSTPSGATVYLDGANMNLFTPAVLTNVQPGAHTLRLYLPGFNEYSENFTLSDGGAYNASVNLEQPSTPLPVIAISTPTDNATFNDNVITVSGTIQLRNADQTLSTFTGNTAILTLNGVDRDISVGGGFFSESVSISSGENTLVIRANGPNGDTGVSDLLTIVGEFVAPDVEVTLTWSTPTADLDLHVWNPNNEHSYYGNKTISDGSLDIDDVNGFGPETFTAQNATAGTYIVKIHNYSLSSDSFSDATVQIKLNGGQEQTFGPHRFTTDGEDWWDVTTFTMSQGQPQFEARTISSKSAQKIINDMKSLKAK